MQHKRIRSINEINFALFLPYVTLAIIFTAYYFLTGVHPLLVFIVVSIVIFWVPFSTHNIYLRIISRRLPAKCQYNLSGYIEIHIANKANKNVTAFFVICAKAILLAYSEKRDVLFTTWIIKNKNLKLIFGDSIEVYTLKPLERVSNMLSRGKFKASKKLKSHTYIVRTSKLSEGSLSILNDIANGVPVKEIIQQLKDISNT